MLYYAGQGIGIVASILCIILPLFRKKWKMLICSGISALCFGLNLILIGQNGTGVFISLVCVLQNVIALWHVAGNMAVSKIENIIFLMLYVCCGAVGYKNMLDILPILASVFNMLAAFQPDVQKTRVFLLLNAISFCIYYGFVGATAVIAEVFAIFSTAGALIKSIERKNLS